MLFLKDKIYMSTGTRSLPPHNTSLIHSYNPKGCSTTNNFLSGGNNFQYVQFSPCLNLFRTTLCLTVTCGLTLGNMCVCCQVSQMEMDKENVNPKKQTKKKL